MKRARNKSFAANVLEGRELLLGVCGGIAAYKVPELVRTLRGKKANVTCVLTRNGARFVTSLTLQTLSCNKTYEEMFDTLAWNVEHISLADRADLIVVAPATADCLARLAAGRAGDLLSSVILAAKKPVLLCPAMNENMWLHPATRRNVSLLKEYGYRFVEPEEGALACGITGIGRLAGLDVITRAIEETLSAQR